MNDDQMRHIAAQLRKPSGEQGAEVGRMMNTGNDLMNRYTLEALPLTAGCTILEVGMGNGAFVPELFTMCSDLHYHGCDYSELMVSEATELNAELCASGKASFECADIIKLPYPDRHFDLIFTVNTLYFWDDTQAALAELGRVLRTGGHLVISIRPKSVMQHYPFVKHGFAMYEPEELASLLASEGFKVIRQERKEEPVQNIGDQSFDIASLITVSSLNS